MLYKKLAYFFDFKSFSFFKDITIYFPRKLLI